jgi:hypothetical protein
MPVEWPDWQWVSYASSSTVNLVPITYTAATTNTTTSTCTVTAGANTTWTWYDLSGAYRTPTYDLPAHPSLEELEYLERSRIEREVEAAARRARRTQAVDRSTELLLAVLSAEQRARYQTERVLEVIGSHGGRYRIRPGSMANVDALDPASGEVVARLCAHPDLWDGHGSLPNPDIALGQLLHLTTDEPGFCRLANVHMGRRPGVAALAA